MRPVRALRSIAAKNFHSGGKGEANFGCWGEVLFLRSDLLEYFKRTVLVVVFLVFFRGTALYTVSFKGRGVGGR